MSTTDKSKLIVPRFHYRRLSPCDFSDSTILVEALVGIVTVYRIPFHSLPTLSSLVRLRLINGNQLVCLRCVEGGLQIRAAGAEKLFMLARDTKIALY